MGIGFAANVGRNWPFQTRFAKLFQRRLSEIGVFQRSRAQPNQWIMVGAGEAISISPRPPQREHTEHAACLLEAWQCLPLALEDGQYHWMERVGSLKGRSRIIHGEPIGQLLAVLDHPISV